MKTIVFIPDTHHPYHDVRAVRLVLDFIRATRPDTVVLMGDHLDFGPISRYDQDPRYEVNIQVQLEETGFFLDDVRSAAGRQAEIVYIEGNHEYRINKYLVKNAPKLLFLKSEGEQILSVPYLLGLKRRGIRWVPASESLELYGYVVEHGDRASSYSAYTARRMVDARRSSVVIGHCHRLGSYWHTGYAETVHGVELGCLIDRNSDAASYAKSPNWQTGFGVGQLDTESGLFQVTPIWIQDRGFIWGGRVYRRDDPKLDVSSGDSVA